MATNRGPGRGSSRATKRPTPGSRPTSAPRSAPRTPSAPTASRRNTPPHLWRLGAFIVLLGFLALFLTPTLRGYLDQRAAISRAEQQIATEQAKIDGIEAELERWDDDSYVEQQARERLRFVKPGEVAFTVLDDTGEQLSEPLPGMTPVTEDVHAQRPWYGQVWESVITANEGVPEPEAPAPGAPQTEPAPEGEAPATDAPDGADNAPDDGAEDDATP
ncbi:septum formation initiator family protein [Ornithinimicrobium faecis]|uniref:Septum formation initiator family protein n=1 Tax=Ornithinimicrobium faecis TaxID=2934158 RepID=A0ABY4YRN4_9MICO|nr:septum formation initiator family protein [Ornithinimicrobium sp. HY1793]USQ79434.1 septum formation initiator family protein [Ornithinimicrobium sp. HY1793]